MPTSPLPPETDRVRLHTPPEINKRIDADIDWTIQRYNGASPEEITQRIDELDKEWDIERALETNAATVALLSLVLSRLSNASGCGYPPAPQPSCYSMPCRAGVRRFRCSAG
jgi:hypothetical protein